MKVAFGEKTAEFGLIAEADLIADSIAIFDGRTTVEI